MRKKLFALLLTFVMAFTMTAGITASAEDPAGGSPLSGTIVI